VSAIVDAGIWSEYPNWLTSLKTGPTVEPVTLEDAKTHLRVDNTDEDDLIEGLIQTAREYCETFTGRAFITQTWYWKADRFPYFQKIYLPRPPLVSITAVSYVDQNGTTQTWAPTTGYQLSQPAGPKAGYASILPAYGTSWPTTRYQLEAVTVEYVCGYGQPPAVPASIPAAMKLLIGHLYENREAVVLGVNPLDLPLAIPALLGPFCVGRF
jgi:uncharacterized phiE125 gp8 family phage protein